MDATTAAQVEASLVAAVKNAPIQLFTFNPSFASAVHMDTNAATKLLKGRIQHAVQEDLCVVLERLDSHSATPFDTAKRH
jgi:hypothetical protein